MERTCLGVLLIFALWPSPVGAVGAAKMYWSDRGSNTIRRANLDGSFVETLVSGLGEARGMAVDWEHHWIYWADNGRNLIQRSRLDGSGIEDLVTTGLNFPAGIALDVAGGKMYWADANNRKLQRANLDGSQAEDLVTGLGAPYFVTLDLTHDHVYWTDYGTDKIQRANLDGSAVVDLVTTGLDLPRGIDLDLEHNQMYWVDRGTDLIQRSDLDGGNIETLLQITPSSAAPHGIALDVDRGEFYWVDNGKVTLERAELDGSNPTVILDASSGVLNRPWQITLDLRSQPPVPCPSPTGCSEAESAEYAAERLNEIARTVLEPGPFDPVLDYTLDGQISSEDTTFYRHYVLNVQPGDANLDGQFNSADLVQVFQAGEYEDALPRNSGWMTGDWDADLEFSSADLVEAFSVGGYEAPGRIRAVPEPAISGMISMAALCVVLLIRPLPAQVRPLPRGFDLSRRGFDLSRRGFDLSRRGRGDNILSLLPNAGEGGRRPDEGEALPCHMIFPSFRPFRRIPPGCRRYRAPAPRRWR